MTGSHRFAGKEASNGFAVRARQLLPSSLGQQKNHGSCHQAVLYTYLTFIEGSLEVKLPTIWTDEKQSRAEAERRERSEEKRVEEKE